MTVWALVVGYLVLERVGEVVLSRRNRGALLAAGGVEHGGRHYPAMIALHVGWLAALLTTIDPATPASAPLLAAFWLLQLGRAWVVATLGPRWTIDIVVLPGAERIRSGPYRWLDHPNYLIAGCELVVAPLVFGAWTLAAVSAVLGVLVLRAKVQVEDAALAEADGARRPAPGAAARSVSH